MAMWRKNTAPTHHLREKIDRWLSHVSVNRKNVWEQNGFFLYEVHFSYGGREHEKKEYFLSSPLIMEGVFQQEKSCWDSERLTAGSRKELYQTISDPTEATFQQAKGEFSIAWKTNDNSLILATSAYATRPIYYYHGSNGFYASNDLRFLFLIDQVPFLLDEEMCRDYPTNRFSIGENDLDGKTFFQGVKRIPSATILSFRNHHVQETCYWGLEDLLDNPLLDQESIVATREEMIQAVSMRLSSGKTLIDVSGGLDSANIFAAAIASGAKEQIVAVNMSFAENDMSYSHDRELIQKMFTEMKVPNAIIWGDELNRIPNAELGRDPLWYIDGPNPCANPLSIEMTSAVGQEVGAVRSLSGDGGDFIFSGEFAYFDSLLSSGKVREAIRSLWILSKGKVIPFLRSIWDYGLSPFLPYLSDRKYYSVFWEDSTSIEMNFFTQEHVKRERKYQEEDYQSYRKSKPLKDWIRRYHYDFLYPRARYLDTSCSQMQLMHPYYDRSLLELTFAIPPEEHFDLHVASQYGNYAGSKQILRKLFPDILPEYLLNRRTKTTYAHMARKSLQKEKYNLLQLFSPSETVYTADLSIIDRRLFYDYLLAMLIRCEDPNNDLGMGYQYFRSVLDLEIWLREIKRGREYVLHRSKPSSPRFLSRVDFHVEGVS